MASVTQPGLYGSSSIDYERPSLILQWHITAKCDQACKHCYLINSPTYQSELKNELNFEICKQLIDEFGSLTEQLNINGRINLTGGDPLLRPDFWEILEYIKKYKKLSVGVLGNPYHITADVAGKLKENRVAAYQISLDGLEKTHDYLRRSGSFNDSLRALELLNKARIKTAVMFTLSKLNASELPELFKFLSTLNFINVFCFDRLVPEGQGKCLVDDSLSPEEHREILYKMFLIDLDNAHHHRRIVLSKKDELWKLFYQDFGLLTPLPKTDQFVNGCSVGFRLLTILSDGTIYACRRLSEKFGKYPDDSLWNVLVSNKELNEYRHLDNYTKCKDCELGYFCRGCPAVKKGYTGNSFAEDPHCWKKIKSD